MRIDALSQINQVYGVSGVKKVAPVSKNAGNDQLQISEFGKDLQIAKQAVAAAPDVREDKVAEIKERLASGTYNVSAEELAEKLASQFDALA